MKKIIVLLALLFPVFAVSGITAQDAGTRPVITRDNAHQVELLHVIGRGRIYDVDWSSDGEHIAVFSENTVTVHDADNLSDKQVLQMEPCSLWHFPCRGTVDFVEDGQTLVVGGSIQLTTYDTDFSPIAVYEDFIDKSVLIYNQTHEMLVYGGGPPDPRTSLFQGFDPNLSLNTVDGSFDYERGIVFSSGPPRSISLSPDGRLLAITSGLLMTDEIWDRSTRTTVYNLDIIFKQLDETGYNDAYVAPDDKTAHIPLDGNSDALTHVTFSPDGALLAGAVQDGRVRLWSIPDGAEVAVYDVHYTAAWDVAFSPDGTQLVSAGGDGTIRFRDVATGVETLVISGLGTAISTISYNPDGTRLVAGGWDGSLRIFDTATGEIIEELEPLSLPAWVIAFSPDGTQFAIGTDGNDVVLFDVIDEPPFIVEKYTFRKHVGPVYALAFHPTEPRLASGGSDGAIYEWDIETGELVREIEEQDQHRTIFGLAYNPNAGSLRQATFPGPPDYTGQPLPPVYDVEFSPDGTLLATGDVILSNPQRYSEVTLEPRHGSGEAYSSSRNKLTFSADGSVLLSAGTTQDAYIWRMDDLTNETEIWGDGLLALSPDGSLVAGGNLSIYNSESGEEIVSISLRNYNSREPNFDLPYDAEFSPDGTLIVTSSVDGMLRFWGIPAD